MIKDFDDILVALGTGKWNYIFLIGAGSCTFWLPAIVIASTFVAPNTEFFCAPTEINGSITLNKCTYTVSSLENNASEEHKCTKWNFNQTDSSNTLTSEYNLVCDSAYLRPVYQMAYMLGNIVGAPISGVLSDRFGRKKIVAITTLSGILSVLASFFVGSVNWIIAARFVTGLSFHSLLLSSYTLFMEVLEPNKRSTYGILYSIPWSFGTMWWGCLGYLIRDWRWLQTASLSPIIVIVICLFLFDESPRWLIVNGKHEEALKVLQRAAKLNGVEEKLPPNEQLKETMLMIQKKETANSPTLPVKVDQEVKKDEFIVASYVKKIVYLVTVLFKTYELRRVTLLMYFSFFVAGFVYYGLSLNASNFNLNPYTYIVVVGATQLPVYMFAGHIIKWFGRVKPTVVTFIVCGVTVLVLSFVPTEPKWMVILMAIFGNSCIAAAFQIIFLMGTEVFPTEVRSQGFGTSSFLSSVGGGTAPFTTEILGSIYHWIPALLFGALSMAAGVAAFYIPETLKRHMPETIEELEYKAKKDRSLSRNT